MHAAVKLLVGVVFIIAGLWLVIPGQLIPKASGFDWSGAFVTVLKGTIPALLVFIGLLVVWIESEELKAPVQEKK